LVLLWVSEIWSSRYARILAETTSVADVTAYGHESETVKMFSQDRLQADAAIGLICKANIGAIGP